MKFIDNQRFFNCNCLDNYFVRSTKQALNVFKGHRKAVSYVKFLNSCDLVSASTDSQLKLWNVNKSHCLRSFTGSRHSPGVLRSQSQCFGSRVYRYGYGISDLEPRLRVRAWWVAGNIICWKEDSNKSINGIYEGHLSQHLWNSANLAR
jgi:WD40 repeat protein